MEQEELSASHRETGTAKRDTSPGEAQSLDTARDGLALRPIRESFVTGEDAQAEDVFRRLEG